MRVRIISGGYGNNVNGSVELVYQGQTCDVDDAEAARLVEIGAAEYVSEEKPQEAVATPPPDQGSNDQGSDILNSGGSTTRQETGESNEPTLEIVDGHYTIESLMETMTRKQLEAMAKNMDLDVSKCNNKEDVAVLIASVEVEAEDGDDDEKPPQIAPEEPV